MNAKASRQIKDGHDGTSDEPSTDVRVDAKVNGDVSIEDSQQAPRGDGIGTTEDAPSGGEAPRPTVDHGPHHQSRNDRSKSPLPSMVNGIEPHSTPAPNDAMGPEPAGRSAVSPATSSAEQGTHDDAAGQKSVDIPKQPDTPDSTQQPPPEDPTTMDIDAMAEQLDSNDTTEAQKAGTSGTGADKDTDSQRPTMRVDTSSSATGPFRTSVAQGITESPAAITGAAVTPRRPQPATPSGPESSKRATRISSGVLQKKSVSEILNEAQRAASHSDSPMSDSRESVGAIERREKERTKLSTVVFAKPQKADGEGGELIRPDPNSPLQGSTKERDYLYTLFENKAHSMTRNGAMNYLITNAHKTLSTADHLVDYQMQTDCRILKRIYQLQERGRWALRQHKRAEEAPRPTSHWDILLDHAKWMRTDFREERKWKLAAARGLAEECAEWVNSSSSVRKQMQVKVRLPTSLPPSASEEDADVMMVDETEQVVSSHPTPDLIPSNEDDSLSDEVIDPRDLVTAVPPAAIFSLGASEFKFEVDKTPAFDKLLNELPLYEPAPIIPDYAKSDLAERLDARWKTDIIPVSKYTTEKLEPKEDQLRPKRSRYEYDLEMSPTRKTQPIPPREKNVALFASENKQIRDRIHPGHSFRPPSEFPMPTQDFFQTRSSSQWTSAEDDELRRLVKEYSYNWSLISSCLTQKSMYSSGAERRTPWECFERWIGSEGLPADMSKTPYFKTYSGRIEAAGRHVLAQIEEAQRRAGANVQIPPRKRTTQPVKVDRKRTQRHLAILDAMRRNAKKRELAQQKQEHQSQLAAQRKIQNSEINQPKAPFSTPREFAALRQERDAKRAEQQEIYRQQLLAHQRAAQQRGQNPGMAGLPNGMPNTANGMRLPSGGMPGMPNGNLQVPNGGRPHPAVMAAMNGIPMPQGMMGPKNMAQQAQMQANMARGMPTSPEQMRMMQQATKVQQQQELMRQAQQGGVQHSSPNNAHAGLANGNFNMANGAPSPSNLNGTASSPRSQNSAGQLSSGHVPVLTQIANRIKQQFPNMADEEVQKHATTQIQMWQQSASNQGQKRPQPQNQAALNAAVGAMNSAAHASNQAVNANFPQHQAPSQMSPEQMQQIQRMRMIQAQQQQQNGAARQPQHAANMPGMNMGLQSQMMSQGQMAANSPVMNMARPVSQGNTSQISRSATPNTQNARSGSMSAQQQQQAVGSPVPQQVRPGSSKAMQGLTPQPQQNQPTPTQPPAQMVQQQQQQQAGS